MAGMSPGEIAIHQARTGFWTSRTVSPVVREPQDNVYGRFKVLLRSDGLYVVHDTAAWPPSGAVFRSLDEAVSWAKLLQ